MKRRAKPRLLMLTSSFPNSPDDETCGYIRDFGRILSSQFDVTVLSPPSRGGSRWPPDCFSLVRSGSPLPLALDPFQARLDLNDLAARNWIVKLAAWISLLCFALRALSLVVRADVVCSHWMVPSGIVGSLISRLLRKPHVVVEHSGALHLLSKMRGGGFVARAVVRGSARVTTVSESLREKLIALCPEASSKVDVIPMGIDLPTLAATSPREHSACRELTVLFIGRLTEVKGLDVLLRAMKGLDNCLLIVAGAGNKREELERAANALSVKAKFIGQVDAIKRRELLSNCDVVVIPSRVLDDGRTEGTPVVCLEALAAGCVVVAAAVGGLAEIIVDRRNGLLFEGENDVALREILKLALGDESLRRALSLDARRSAKRYDWALAGPQFAKLLMELIGKADANATDGLPSSLTRATSRDMRASRAQS